MYKLIIASSILLLTVLISANQVSACTDFRMTAKDGTVLVTRSMEFGLNLKSNLRTSNRGRVYASSTINGKPSMSWRATYGYVFVDGLDQDFAVDGMNEAGLSFEALLFPGFAQYQTIPVGQEKQAIPYIQFGDWVLSNFKTVDEVKNALPHIMLYTQLIPGVGDFVFPLHYSIQDMSGRGIVVEFVKNKVNVYDNDIGMMTNSPTYDWQLSNLRNYLNLTPYNPQPVTVNGVTFAVTGQGAGMVGLPGDVSPPSRFVKMSFMTRSVYPAADAATLLNLAEHIINNVDIPAGLARAIDNGKESSDITQWVVFKDLTHKMFYYRNYNDMTLRVVALDKLSFSDSTPRLKMPLLDTPYILDETSKFQTSK